MVCLDRQQSARYSTYLQDTGAGRDFPHPFRPALGPITVGRSFLGVQRPGRGFDYPSPYKISGKIKNRAIMSTPLPDLHGLSQGDFYL